MEYADMSALFLRDRPFDNKVKKWVIRVKAVVAELGSVQFLPWTNRDKVPRDKT